MITTLKEQIKNPAPEPSYKMGCRESVTGEVRILVKKEKVKFRGIQRTVRRVYVCDPITQEPGVGWAIDLDVLGCMVCGEPFGLMRWPHHCRCCGNVVCNPCSPEEVEVIEIEKLGPVRVCVLCFWGQHPVHANYHLETLNNSDNEDGDADTDYGNDIDLTEKRVSEVEMTAPQSAKPGLTPVPLFVVEFYRKLSLQEMGNTDARKRVVFVNICIHDAMLSLPEEQEFVICDEVYTCEEAIDGINTEADVYHALLRPDLIEADFNEDNIDQFEEVALVIVNELTTKFNLRIAKKFRVLPDRKYAGTTGYEVHIPEQHGEHTMRAHSFMVGADIDVSYPLIRLPASC